MIVFLWIRYRNKHFLQSFPPTYGVKDVLRSFILSSDCSDKLVWGLNRDEIYSVKLRVKFLQSLDKLVHTYLDLGPKCPS